jgi:hypothetical protein
MNIYFTFKKGTHIGIAFEKLKAIFKTMRIKKEKNERAELVVDARDFEQNKKDFPYTWAIKLTRCRSDEPTVLEHLVMGWNQFDNKKCQQIISTIIGV